MAPMLLIPLAAAVGAGVTYAALRQPATPLPPPVPEPPRISLKKIGADIDKRVKKIKEAVQSKGLEDDLNVEVEEGSIHGQEYTAYHLNEDHPLFDRPEALLSQIVPEVGEDCYCFVLDDGEERSVVVVSDADAYDLLTSKAERGGIEITPIKAPETPLPPPDRAQVGRVPTRPLHRPGCQ